ncbi:DUF1173 family protein [Pseudomonas sp. 18175]|uniref:DUF1173 family protein n=1 Tax=Pseudomonas sp. 18175 TaxID=3390056 RepID=UPI003D1B4350
MGTRHFALGGHIFEADDPRLQTYLAQLHGTAERPRCLCVPGGVEMYIAHYRQYQIKRMPDTGQLHHPGCAAYAPEAAASGLGALLGEAVREDVPGQVELRVDFPWARLGGRSVVHGPAQEEPGEVQATARRMSLRAVTHFLFERAGFNRWSPAMAGKRSQRVIHHYLMAAARDIRVKGVSLSERLYVPEQFTLEHKADIAQRRRQQLALLNPVGEERPLALILGELKGCEPGGQGHKLWIKHMPEVPLLLNDATWRRLQHSYAALFEARDADSDIPLRLIVTALVYAKRESTYAVEAASLMLTTAEWIAVEGLHDAMLVHALIEQRRRFIKPLRYDATASEAAAFANALLVDAGDAPVPLHVLSPFMKASERIAKERALAGAWCWWTDRGLPCLPASASTDHNLRTRGRTHQS